jgi:hypothetical protein
MSLTCGPASAFIIRIPRIEFAFAMSGCSEFMQILRSSIEQTKNATSPAPATATGCSFFDLEMLLSRLLLCSDTVC